MQPLFKPAKIRDLQCHGQRCLCQLERSWTCCNKMSSQGLQQTNKEIYMSNHIVEAAAISILLPSITKTNPVLAAHYQNRLSLLVDAHTQSLCARRLARGQDPAEALALMDLQNPAREEPLPEQLRVSPASRIQVDESFH